MAAIINRLSRQAKIRGRQQVVDLTGGEEISRRPLLEHLLWAETERGMVESVRA